MGITVQDANLEHLHNILPDVRPADLREWYAGTGSMFTQAATETLTSGGYQKVALLGNLPLCFWGVSTAGEVWLFATTTAERYALGLHRVLRPELDKLFDIAPRLTALADSRNTKHHLWLDWLGFTLEEEVGAGPFGLPFKLYTKEAPSCA
jgi:hypothetical protein